jgi:MFS family permease
LGLTRPPEGSVEDRNAWYVVATMFWAAILHASNSFNSAFAVRLGASNELVGLMSSGRSLIIILLTLPAARFVESRIRRKKWLIGSIFVQRLVYIVIAVMPFVVGRYRAEVFVGLMMLRTLLLRPYSAGWSSFLADLISRRRRTSVLAQRRIVRSAMLIVAVPVMTVLLSSFPFPLGYQLAYGLGFLGAMASTWCLWQVEIPEKRRERVRKQTSRKRTMSWRLLLSPTRLWREDQDYVRFVVPRLIYSWGARMAKPLFIIYYLRYLNASDSWIGLRTSVANVSMMIGFYLWSKLIKRWGDMRSMRIATPLMGLFPLLVGLTGNLTLILGYVMMRGFLVPAANLTFFNVSVRVSPDAHRESYLGLYKVITNVAGLLAPMVGVALVDVIGLNTVLFLAGGFRLAGGLLFTLWPISDAEELVPAA